MVCTTLAFRKGATLAALLGIFSIIVLATIFFPLDIDIAFSTMQTLAAPSVEVIFIILGGMLISRLLEERGAQNYITEHLTRATGTPERASLLIAVGLAPFLESSIGYSLGVLITVPLLRKIGHSVTRAVALSLFGLTMTAWGSLGPGLIVTSELGGVTLQDLGNSLALMAIVPILVLNLGSLCIAVPRKQLIRYGAETVMTTLIMWGMLIITNAFISVALGGIFASLTAIFVFLAFSKLSGTRLRSLADKQLLKASTAYLILIGGVILASLVLPIFESPLLHRFGTSPATWLVISGVLSFWIMESTGTSFGTLVTSSIKIGLKPGSVVVLYILFGGLLSASGMSSALADGAVQFGLWNLLLIPGVNVIAGYITASVSATGAMFSLSVAEASAELGLNTTSVLALQTLASAPAGIIGPSRFAVAAASLVDASVVRRRSNTEKTPSAPGKSESYQLKTGKIIATGFFMVALIVPGLIGMVLLLNEF